jgi:hypothetical protein
MASGQKTLILWGFLSNLFPNPSQTGPPFLSCSDARLCRPIARSYLPLSLFRA